MRTRCAASVGFGALYEWRINAPEVDVRERRVIRTMGAGRIAFGLGTAALPLFTYGERWWPLGVMMLGIAVWLLPGWLYRRRTERSDTRASDSTQDA